MGVFLTENSKAKKSIVIAENAKKTELTAAQELKLHLEKISGATFDIISESQCNENAIYVGHTEYAKNCGITTDENEKWVVCVCDSSLVLIGGNDGNDRGTLYSVYHFLEDILGVRWWTPWDEKIPDMKTIEIDENLNISGKPFMEYRTLYSINFQKDFLYNARNRLNVINEVIDGGMEPECECYTDVGGALYAGPPFGVHTLGLYAPADKYYDEHQEWFAWSSVLEKHIKSGQHCLSNEGFYQFILQKVSENIKTVNEKCQKLNLHKPLFYSISLDDNTAFCECEKCRESMEKSGRMGYLLKFINRLAVDLRKVDEDVMLETLAYFRYIAPPIDDTKIEKNVLVRLADMETDLIHSIDYEGSKRKRDLIDKWGEICENGKIYLWDYWMNEYPNPPLPVALKVGRDFKYICGRGYNGCYIQNGFAENMNFAELTQYITMKMCENPTLDYNKLKDEFIKDFYGDAADLISEYLDVINDAAQKTGFRLKVYEAAVEWNYIDLDTMRKCINIMDEAQKRVEGNSKYSNRVLVERMPLDMTLLAKYHDFVRAAEKQGTTFEYDRNQILERINETINYIIEHRNVNPRTISFYDKIRNLFADVATRKYEEYPLPKHLEGEDREKIYDISFKNLTWLFKNPYCSEVVEDKQAASGKAMVFNYDKMSDGMKIRFKMTNRNDKNATPFPIELISDNEERRKIYIYNDDLSGEEYKWFKISDIKNVTPASNTSIWFPTDAVASVSLSGISSLFPLGDCDVHISMKSSGEVYGGNEGDKNRLYFDRMIIVKK